MKVISGARDKYLAAFSLKNTAPYHQHAKWRNVVVLVTNWQLNSELPNNCLSMSGVKNG